MSGKNVVVTAYVYQAITSNPNVSDLFACKWLRAPATTASPRDQTGPGGFALPPRPRRLRQLSAFSPRSGTPTASGARRPRECARNLRGAARGRVPQGPEVSVTSEVR